MGIIRTTISLEDSELAELQSLAQKQNETLSGFLVSRGLGRDHSALPAFDRKSLQTIRAWLSRELYPHTEVARLELESPSIFDAIKDFSSAARIYGDDFAQALDSSEFIPQLVPYPMSQTAETGKFQEALLQEISGLPDIGMRGTFGLEMEHFDDAPGSPRNQKLIAHHFVRPGLVGSKPIVYVFPFFRPNNRRPLWGVIDYARHEQIGLLLHKEIFGATVEPGATLDMRRFSKNRAYTWLGQQVIDVLCAKKEDRLRIGFREGFFESEMAEILWSHAQSHMRFSAFEKYRNPYSAEELETVLSSKKEVCSVVVVDLLEQKFMTKEIWQDWGLVIFPHHQTIPVGIGFTLSMLPRLLVHDNWKALKNKASQLIKEQGFETVLTTCGILMNDEQGNGVSI